MNENNQELNVRNLLKFIIDTIAGIFLVLVPFKFKNGLDTILFHYLKLVVSWGGWYLQVGLTVVIVISAILSLIDLSLRPGWIRNHPIMQNLFSTTPFYVLNRVLGAIIAVLFVTKVGPQWLISVNTGGTMVPLATQLAILVPAMFLLQTLILEYGGMEFIGKLIGKFVTPIFKVSQFASVNIITAWIGPGNAAIMGTRDLYDQGYLTRKESAIIGSQFATGSIGWIILISSVLGLARDFGQIFLTITVVGMIVAAICVRLPPVSKYPATYVNGSEVSPQESERQTTTNHVLMASLKLATERAAKVTRQNYTDKISNMLFYVFWLTPVIVFWGTAALALSTYTPILKWLAEPIHLILSICHVQESAATASAIMAGLADNYLPVILGSTISSPQSKFIIAVMSILSLIYLSEIAPLLRSTKIINSFPQLIFIFVERTLISLPFVILAASLFY